MRTLLAAGAIALLAILEMEAPLVAFMEDDTQAPISSTLDDAGSAGLTADPAIDIQGP